MRERLLAVFLLMLAVPLSLLVLTSPVAAYQETTGTVLETPSETASFGHVGCIDCHAYDYYSCGTCHAGYPGDLGQGPHGDYTATGTSGPGKKCGICHTIHVAGGVKLLPGQTVKDSCNACHDGTGGHGVYGSLTAQGVAIKAAHHIDDTRTIPGGSASSGGSVVSTFTGQGYCLSCDDCHSPHENDVVAPFIAERQRTTLKWQKTGSRHHVIASTKLLKRRPTGASTEATAYGSDWCLTCHAGRASGGAVHNHPVDSLVATTAPFNYSSAAILTTDAPTRSTTVSPMGGWNRPSNGWTDPVKYAENRGYLMPYPRTPEQAGHAPICQQCHGDARNVGSLSSTGLADALPFQVTHEDGKVATDNPRFQNFPHEAANGRFLVENDDDLCLNCHPTTGLP